MLDSVLVVIMQKVFLIHTAPFCLSDEPHVERTNLAFTPKLTSVLLRGDPVNEHPPTRSPLGRRTG